MSGTSSSLFFPLFCSAQELAELESCETQVGAYLGTSESAIKRCLETYVSQSFRCRRLALKTQFWRAKTCRSTGYYH